MKKLLLSVATAVAALTLSAPTFAADMPVKAPPMVAPVMNWTGFYFGGSLGGAWDQPDPSCSPISGVCTVAFNRASSWVGGLHTTTLWQFNHLILGLDTNYRFTDLNTSALIPASGATQTQRTQNIFTTGGRLGFAWNTWQLYGTGGYARTLIEGTGISAAGVLSEASGHWHDGWFGGMGVEYAYTPSIHFALQYTRVHANTELQVVNPTIPVDNHTANANIDMIEARVSFKLWEGMWGPFK